MTEFYRQDAYDESLGTFDSVSKCKIAYSWSVAGDWTLRLRYYQQESDCLSFDSSSLSVQQVGGNWTVVENDDQLLLNAPSERECERIIEVIQHYGLNQVCYIGRPNPSMTYFLVDGSAPEGRIPGDDVLNHNMYPYEVVEEDDRLTVTDGMSAMLSCSNYREAAKALEVLRKYRFDKAGYVGRPDPSMEYFLTTRDTELPDFEDLFDFERPFDPEW
jgi:hypothetical protein